MPQTGCYLKETPMVDISNSWVRFRDLPDDVLDDVPEYVRAMFLAARQHGFEVELLCAGVTIPSQRRARRRFVLVADDLNDPDRGGPLTFDLAALSADVLEANRLFIISASSNEGIYAAAYAAAIEDLSSGFNVAVVVETRPAFAQAWARTLASLQNGGQPMSLGEVDSAKHRPKPVRRSGRKAMNT
jgi:hypothetical protein